MDWDLLPWGTGWSSLTGTQGLQGEVTAELELLAMLPAGGFQHGVGRFVLRFGKVTCPYRSRLQRDYQRLGKRN